MKTFVCSLIMAWNGLLAIIGRSLGLFFGGLIIGFVKGMTDQTDMIKYLTYKKYMIQKELKEKDDGNKSD